MPTTRIADKPKTTTQRTPPITVTFDAGVEMRADESEQQRKFLEAFAGCDHWRKACRTAQIEYRQVERWKLDPDFKQRMDDVHQANVDAVEATLTEIAKDVDAPANARVAAATKYLEANRSELYWRGGGDSTTVSNQQFNFYLTEPPKEKQLPASVDGTYEVVDANDKTT